MKNYLRYYTDVPKGTKKILPLIVIESIAICVTFFISIYLVKALHFSPFQVGKLISMVSLGTCIGSILSGYLTTRISLSTICSIGFLLYGLSFCCLALSQSFSYLLVILFISGMGSVFVMVANFSSLLKLANNDLMKNRVIVLHSVIFNLSASIGSFLMSYLQHDSLRTFFLIFGPILFITGLLLLSSKDTCITAKPLRDNKVLKINITRLSAVFFMIFLYGTLYSLIKIYFPLEGASRFNNIFYSWIILSINPFMVICFQPWLIYKLKNKENTFILFVGTILLGTGYVFFGLSMSIIPSLFFIILGTIGEMMFSPISKKITATAFGPGNEGIGVASWKMSYHLSGAFGAIFISYLDETFVNLNVWYLLVPLTFMMVVCILFYAIGVGLPQDITKIRGSHA